MLTFTAGFARAGYSEIDQAQETAAALGLKSMPYVITPTEFAARLPQIIWHLDDPMADAAAIPLWFIAREARRHVKVVLSGEGADELFGGYGVYYQPSVVRAATRLPALGPVLGGRDGRPDTAGAAWQGAAAADRDTAAQPLHRQRQRLRERGNRRSHQVWRRHACTT